MKRIIVNAYEIALISKRGRVDQVLSEGKHWIGFGCSVSWHSTLTPFVSNMDLSVVIKNDQLAAMLDIYTIKDHEVGFELKNGNFNRVLNAGQVAYWKDTDGFEVVKVDLRETELSQEVIEKVSLKHLLGIVARAYTVAPYQRGVLYIDGKYQKVLEPGVYYYIMSYKNITIEAIDVRVQAMEILGQEILTKDKIGIRINFQVQYQVIDIEKSIKDSKDYDKQLYVLLQIALREYIGSLTIDQLLTNKEKVGKYIVDDSLESAIELGVQIKTGGIKDIILPGDIKDIMNQVLIAQKKAQANTIARQEETASTRSLLNTAKLMQDNSMLLKLKEMEYMEKIAEKIGEITVNGGSQVMDQLKELVIAK